MPGLYDLWSGRTADQANLDKLAAWLKRHGYGERRSLVVGDRATLSDELALAYDQHQLDRFDYKRTKNVRSFGEWCTIGLSQGSSQLDRVVGTFQ